MPHVVRVHASACILKPVIIAAYAGEHGSIVSPGLQAISEGGPIQCHSFLQAWQGRFEVEVPE